MQFMLQRLRFIVVAVAAVENCVQSAASSSASATKRGECWEEGIEWGVWGGVARVSLAVGDESARGTANCS